MKPYRWPPLRWLFLLVWRLRERDVTDRVTAGPYAAPDYRFGKVTGQVPDLRVITETTESPWVCCGYCSAAMASWTAREGLAPKMGGTAHPIRAEGGRPHQNGSRASELRDGAKRAHDVKLDALAVDEIRDWLRKGYAVVVNLDYAQLPGYLRVQSGSFGHSCCLQGFQDDPDGDLVGFFDPLWPQDARGAWARWADVKAALWGDGEHSGTTTRWGDPGPEPGPPDPEPPPPEPEPVPEPVGPTPGELLAVVVPQVLLERDRAWRGTLGEDQPRVAGSWGPVATDVPVRWGWFARWGPEPPPGSWSGPAASWSSGTPWA